ncbi:MAG: sigma-70 family RNA polymerase sigma factor [Bryobacteraceae bacterium]
MADTAIGLPFDIPREAPAGFEVDQALIARLRDCDEAAYELLIARFERPVFNLVYRLMDDPSETADVAQEVFLKVFRNVGTFRQESSLKTWIYRIAVNEARNHRRWFGRHCRQEVGLEAERDDSYSMVEQLTDPGPSPFEVAADLETQALLVAALADVKPAFRAALVLREIEGLSYEEIAQILEVSLGTVKSKILRGREALKESLVARLKPAAGVRHGWRMKEMTAE